jgi:hypothetical protein
MRRFVGVAVVLACVACGCGTQSTLKGPDGAGVPVDQGSAKVQIKGPGADRSDKKPAQAPGKVKVPEDFPKDIPIYPSATPVIHTSAGQSGRTLELKTSDAIAKVKAFYKEKLKAEGWKQDSDSSTEENTLLMNTKDSRTLAVVICHRDDATGLILSVSTPEQPTKTRDVK